ncbi:AAA domain-containing protein [Peptococcus simiae]|uniref:DEAD/DEAH box helicase n=1 Tax=Peptococcus simiae TaxID=1643805 RepID=UPI00397F2AC9
MDKQIDLKNNILDAFIFYENLSEAKLSKDFKKLTRDKLSYNELEKLLPRTGVKKYTHLVLCINALSFKEVLDKLRKKYNLKIVDEEVTWEKTFQYSLVFDHKLNLISDETFISIPYYIYLQGELIKDSKTIADFSDYLIKEIDEIYKQSNRNTEKFLLNLIDSSNALIRADNIYYKGFRTKAEMNTSLHSFVINDLKAAKKCSNSHLLNRFLGASSTSHKINLDSTKPQGQEQILDILAPCNFPLGRFPSNPSHAPSLMQQVAINLRMMERDRLLSVNGPPGTGKTTLLKDVFAGLIVQTSREISKCLGEVTLDEISVTTESSGQKQTFQMKKLSPELLTSNFILASSNNKALENVVVDFSIWDAIHDSFQKPDYFPFEIEGEEGDFATQKMWGSFSLRGGAKAKRRKITERIDEICLELNQMGKDIHGDFEEKNSYPPPDFFLEIDCGDFNSLYDKVQEEINNTQNAYEKLKKISEVRQVLESYPSLIKELTNEVFTISESLKELNDDLETAQKENNKILQTKPRFFLIKKLLRAKDAKIYLDEINKSEEMISEVSGSIEEGRNNLDEKKDLIDQYKRDLEQAEINMQSIEKILGDFKELNKPVLDFKKSYQELDFKKSYQENEKIAPWFNDEFRKKQSHLFIKALGVRKAFLSKHRDSLKVANLILNDDNKWKIKQQENGREVLLAAWNWINFAIPVISTTFASMSNMFDFAGSEDLPNLFIDEAGQAAPQDCIGGLMRARQVMALGDPFQIEPVKTLDSQVLGVLQNHFLVSDRYLAAESSCQTILDASGSYGFKKDEDKDKDTWIGIPLWVHRRCAEPMFSISNAISYGERMVQGLENNIGFSAWYDVTGTADNKFVQEQAECVEQLLEYLITEEGYSNKDMYIISPFRNVAMRIKEHLRKERKEHLIHNTNEQIGTVHTFQGKQNDIVILVMGADKNSLGAANWAVSKPNIMNVAATRAKKRFYIIGDKGLYKGLHSNVVNETLDKIENYIIGLKENYLDG